MAWKKMKESALICLTLLLFDGASTFNVAFNHEVYQPIANIYAFVKGLPVRYRGHSDVSVSLETIGSSHEDNELIVVQIGKALQRPKKVIWVDGGLHAREWISPAVCLQLIERLIATAAEANSPLNDFDFFVLPLANPDGYAYSWSAPERRLWRKNRRNNTELTFWKCQGVDLNRNFGVGFGGEGSSNDPCSDTYRGEFSFSEPETVAIRDALLKILAIRGLEAFLTVHSYGQMIVGPYSYVKDDTADKTVQAIAMEVMSTAMKRPNSRTYYGGPGWEVLYVAGGTAKDWVYDQLGVVHAYTVEMPPVYTPKSDGPEWNVTGFELDDFEIDSAARELFAGVRTLADFLSGDEEIRRKVARSSTTFWLSLRADRPTDRQRMK